MPRRVFCSRLLNFAVLIAAGDKLMSLYILGLTGIGTLMLGYTVHYRMYLIQNPFNKLSMQSDAVTFDVSISSPLIQRTTITLVYRNKNFTHSLTFFTMEWLRHTFNGETTSKNRPRGCAPAPRHGFATRSWQRRDADGCSRSYLVNFMKHHCNVVWHSWIICAGDSDEPLNSIVLRVIIILPWSSFTVQDHSRSPLQIRHAHIATH